MAKAPRYCRKAAYDLFVRQLSTIEETRSLVRAAVAVSMHELSDVDVEQVENTLNQIAAEITGRVSSGHHQALIAQLHEVLFEEWGFTGNTENYYAAENSYLSKVLETRRGIPVTLSLVYKSVAQYAGLTARGINAPAHFLAAVEDDGKWMMIDPFLGGKVLATDEVFQRLEKLAETPLDPAKLNLGTATHLQWIGRIIRNLELVFQQSGRQDDVLAMRELFALVDESDDPESAPSVG